MAERTEAVLTLDDPKLDYRWWQSEVEHMRSTFSSGYWPERLRAKWWSDIG